MRSDFHSVPAARQSAGLVDLLDRVLDKGLVVAGDIKVSLAEVELLTIRIRLIVCSLDKAQEIGMDWWRYDPHFSPRGNADHKLALENEELRQKIQKLERRLTALIERGKPGGNGSNGKRPGNGQRKRG